MKWLNRTLITSPYCYALCLSESEFTRELRRLKIPPAKQPAFIGNGISSGSNATTHFFEKNKGNNLSAVVCLGDTKKIPIESILALLTHESVHIWQAIRDEIGETKPSHEFEAYAIQQIAQNLMQSYRKQKK